MNNNEGDRRTFLKSLLAGSAVAVGAAATTKPTQAAPAKKHGQPGQETLYRETDEFKRYYQSLQY